MDENTSVKKKKSSLPDTKLEFEIQLYRDCLINCKDKNERTFWMTELQLALKEYYDK